MITLSKTLYLVAGLPRSGSTLLMNILGQNPRFAVGGTSGIIDILQYVRNSWGRNSAFQSLEPEVSAQLQVAVLRGAFEGYLSIAPQPVCFDKNRFWPEFLEMAALILGGRERVKVLVTVRDLRDVLASFERLYRQGAATGPSPYEGADPIQFKTALQRIEVISQRGQPVGRAFNGLCDAVTRGWLDCLHFVEFDALTTQPDETLAGIYRFLGESAFPHDFQNIQQLTTEDDRAYGLGDIHTVRPSLTPMPPSWPTVFDQTVRGTAQWQDVERLAHFWRAWTQRERPA